MNPSAQAKVLRVLQENELERVGGARDHQGRRARRRRDQQGPQEPRSQAGRFREDLYYRLERWCRSSCRRCASAARTCPSLVEHFLDAGVRGQRHAHEAGRAGGDDAAHAARLAGQRARAASNVVERLAILTGDADVIGEADVGDALPRREGGQARASRAARRSRISSPPPSARSSLAALEANDHHVSNTARELAARAQPPLQEDARARHRPSRRRKRAQRRRRRRSSRQLNRNLLIVRACVDFFRRCAPSITANASAQTTDPTPPGGIADEPGTSRASRSSSTPRHRRSWARISSAARVRYIFVTKAMLSPYFNANTGTQMNSLSLGLEYVYRKPGKSYDIVTSLDFSLARRRRRQLSRLGPRSVARHALHAVPQPQLHLGRRVDHRPHKFTPLVRAALRRRPRHRLRPGRRAHHQQRPGCTAPNANDPTKCHPLATGPINGKPTAAQEAALKATERRRHRHRRHAASPPAAACRR